MGQQRVSAPIAERGVYWAMATKRGRPMAFAVDSSGNEVRRLILEDDSWARAERAVEWLWHYLDNIDPPRRLHLVKPIQRLPSTVQRERPAIYDPYADPSPIPGPWRRPW